MDEIYQEFILDPLWRVSDSLWRMVDESFIDKIPHALSQMSLWWSKCVRDLQTGKMEGYITYIVFSLVVVISLVLIR